MAGQTGKEYRTPTEHDTRAAKIGRDELAALYAEVPFGMPGEPTPNRPSGMGASRASRSDEATASTRGTSSSPTASSLRWARSCARSGPCAPSWTGTRRSGGRR